ncbi:MAG: GIY-YIG nuclease family protein [Candidatus Diapherotrites archaeon]|jgi:putative endonuclease|uniref:GIY-YIG nuclease family protein n=1 Tax=Candidatus Iainarchaeum sp. TaxID=3101447 RepID=A0A7K4BZG4_9ARCH|nr:GIY-YIG nuclease family protein [Candidatus Diapherotrites archaeon]
MKQQNTPKTYFVYLLECRDGSFYCGQTNDLEKRVELHNKGIASKYTSRKRPVKLIYSEKYFTRSEAMKREYQIKQLTKKEKIELVFSKKMSNNK